jgi:PAS domain-containing protein
LDSANALQNPRENATQSIVAKDAHDLRYIFVNRAAENLFEMPQAEIKIGA